MDADNGAAAVHTPMGWWRRCKVQVAAAALIFFVAAIPASASPA
jgi:hypothetical protein